MTTPLAAQPFVPPSPGSWELERTHFTRPSSKFAAAVFPAAMVRGFSEATRAYGALLDHIELAVVNGLIYSAPRPVGAPKGAKGPPPRALFWLLVRLHPEIRSRVRRSSEVFAEKLWRQELRWWDDEVKPELAAEARALLGEDIEGLDDAGLARYVTRAVTFLDKTVYFHHRLNCCAILPLADFISHVQQWTGMKPETVLLAMRGMSPLSAGASGEIEAVRQAIAGDPEAQAILASGQPAAEVLAALDGRPGVSAPLRTYLDTVGWRVVGGYDVADRLGREHPDLLVKVIGAALRKGPPAPQTTTAEVQAMRAKVPARHQADFDALLEEAQVVYRVRDERNFCCDAMGVGLARRALLEVGRRLQARGRVQDATHLVDATPDEVQALLAGTGGPSGDELATRARFRETTNLDDVPQLLGTPPSPPPPAEWLPGDAARMQRAIDVALGLMFAVAARQEGKGTQLKGVGVSPGTVEGPARVVVDISELPLVREGEVLVTPSTGPTFNVVLPLLRGLVTERGGALSHAAIVAREYGIPGVVGCREATTRIKTGTRVRVDGSKGEVWILE